VINCFGEVNEWNFLLPALLIHHHPHSNQEATTGQDILPAWLIHIDVLQAPCHELFSASVANKRDFILSFCIRSGFLYLCIKSR
jgi:hypothetical protein